MLNPLLTLQMLVCFIATGVCPSLQDKLGSTYPAAPRNLAWETGPPLDAPDPAAPPKPAQWPPYSWQPSPSMTSPVTWPVSPLQNHSADAVSLGHDTASHTMLNPLLTLQMLVCFIATDKPADHFASYPIDHPTDRLPDNVTDLQTNQPTTWPTIRPTDCLTIRSAILPTSFSTMRQTQQTNQPIIWLSERQSEGQSY
ncbi:hypothetical protein MRX96_021688 [Rhipicephalus microplus]